MAPPSVIAVSRVRAPFDNARLLFAGTRWWLGPLILVWLAWPVFMISHDLVFVLYGATLIAPAFAITAAIIDRNVTDRLAFVALLPRAGSPKWLLLAPLLAAASLFVIAAAAIVGHPPLVAMTALGCCWWGISVGRWLGRRWWTLAAIAALALPPAALVPFLRHQQWGATAAVSLGFAALGLLLTPGRRSGATSSRSDATRFTPGRATAVATSLAGASPGAGVSALRLWLLGAPQVPKWALLGCAFGLLGLAWPYAPWLGFDAGLFVLAMCLSVAFGRTNKDGRHEFACTLPIARRRLFEGNVLPWIAPVLVMSVVVLLRLQFESIDGNGPLATLVRSADRLDIFLVRRFGGARDLPASWLPGAFPAHLWPTLVAAIRTHVVCTSLFCLALLFCMNAASWMSDKHVKVAFVPRWSVYILWVLIFFGGRYAVMTRVPSSVLLGLLVIDTAFIWFAVWQLPPTPVAERRGAP